jgi:hypothetical protein
MEISIKRTNDSIFITASLDNYSIFRRCKTNFPYVKSIEARTP